MRKVPKNGARNYSSSYVKGELVFMREKSLEYLVNLIKLHENDKRF
jgi:hypothetical protein